MSSVGNASVSFSKFVLEVVMATRNICLARQVLIKVPEILLPYHDTLQSLRVDEDGKAIHHFDAIGVVPFAHRPAHRR